MKRSTFCMASLLVLLSSVVSLGQAYKPGPEHKRLAYCLGTWTIESAVNASPFGPAGKMTGTETVEPGPGGFFVVFRADFKTPSGSLQRVGVMGYDPHAKSYTWNGFDSQNGIVVTAAGTTQGSVWNWTVQDRAVGKPVRGRFTANEVSPTSYTYKYEIQSDKGSWSTVEDGKATKSK